MEQHESNLPNPGIKTQDELAIFSKIVSAMATLDEAGRLRLFKTLASFFDISFAERQKAPAVHETPHPSDPAGQSVFSRVGPTFSENRAPSPKQFLLEKKPQTDVDRIACLAYYLTHYRNQPHFKTLDLSKLNTEAAQVKFSNPTKAVDNATQTQLLAPAGQAQKQISAVGELYVQALPDRVAAKAAMTEARNKRNYSKSRSNRQAARPKPA